MPPQVSLQNFLQASGVEIVEDSFGNSALIVSDSSGHYVATEAFTSDDERTFYHVRNMAMRAAYQFRIVATGDVRQYRGVLVRSPDDPDVIWVGIDGMAVDRLLRVAVATFPAQWVGPSPILVALGNRHLDGMTRVFVTLSPWKSPRFVAELDRYKPPPRSPF